MQILLLWTQDHAWKSWLIHTVRIMLRLQTNRIVHVVWMRRRLCAGVIVKPIASVDLYTRMCGVDHHGATTLGMGQTAQIRHVAQSVCGVNHVVVVDSRTTCTIDTHQHITETSSNSIVSHFVVRWIGEVEVNIVLHRAVLASGNLSGINRQVNGTVQRKMVLEQTVLAVTREIPCA